MKAWEAKNTKRAVKASGVSLMALSLAACGSEDTTPFAQIDITKAVDAAKAVAATAQTAKDAAVEAKTAAEADAVKAKEAQTEAEEAKATADDALAVQTTAITDAGFADVDALVAAFEAVTAPVSLSLTANNDNLLGNIGDDTFTGTSATIAAADIVNGGDGDGDVMNVTLTAINNSLTVSNVETINVDWDAFGTAAFDATNVSGADIVLTSSKTGFLGSVTVTAAGANTITASTGMDGTLTANGAAADDSDSLTVNIGASATIANNVDDLTVSATAGGLTATINAVDAALVIGGDFDVNLAVTDLLSYTAESITGNVGTVTAASATGATDLTDSVATNYVVEGANNALTLNSGTTVTLEADGGAASAFVVGAAGGSDVLNLVVEADQAAVDSTAETTNVTVSATAVAAAADVTLTTLVGGGDYVFTATSNDFNVDGVVAANVDASAVTGVFDLDQGAAGDLDVTGSATAANTVSFTGTTQTNDYIGGSGNDTVDAATTTNSITAVVGNGANLVTTGALTTGNLVVNGGIGVDTVTAAAITDANVTLELSNGDNNVTFGTAGNAVLDAATIVVITGSGDDTVTLNEDTTANTDMTLNLGSGTNTLVLDAGGDISLGTQSITGVTTLEMTGGGAASTVAASLVSGTTINVTATNTGGDIFTVVGTTAAGETINMSGLVMDQSIGAAVLSTDVTGNAGADTIVGTSIADAIASNGGGDTITGGQGADTITLGAGSDTVVVASGDATATSFDIVTTFTTEADELSLGTAAVLANYAELDGDFVDAGNDAANVALAVTDADTLFDGTVQFAFIFNTDAGRATDGYLIADNDLDGTADMSILLTDLDAAAGFAQGDIIA